MICHAHPEELSELESRLLHSQFDETLKPLNMQDFSSEISCLHSHSKRSFYFERRELTHKDFSYFGRRVFTLAMIGHFVCLIKPLFGRFKSTKRSFRTQTVSLQPHQPVSSSSSKADLLTSLVRSLTKGILAYKSAVKLIRAIFPKKSLEKTTQHTNQQDHRTLQTRKPNQPYKAIAYGNENYFLLIQKKILKSLPSALRKRKLTLSGYKLIKQYIQCVSKLHVFVCISVTLC